MDIAELAREAFNLVEPQATIFLLTMKVRLFLGTVPTMVAIMLSLVLQHRLAVRYRPIGRVYL